MTSMGLLYNVYFNVNLVRALNNQDTNGNSTYLLYVGTY